MPYRLCTAWQTNMCFLVNKIFLINIDYTRDTVMIKKNFYLLKPSCHMNACQIQPADGAPREYSQPYIKLEHIHQLTDLAHTHTHVSIGNTLTQPL